jgi:hypothetical protein
VKTLIFIVIPSADYVSCGLLCSVKYEDPNICAANRLTRVEVIRVQRSVC